MKEKGQDILTAEEAAQYLRVSPRTLRELAGSGAIPARKVGREWRFSRSTLHEWLTRSSEEPTQAKSQKAPGARNKK